MERNSVDKLAVHWVDCLVVYSVVMWVDQKDWMMETKMVDMRVNC